MQKTWITIIVLVSFGLIASSALAQYYGGYMGGSMNGLRQELAARQSEYNALMASSNPDAARAAELNRQIAILNNQMRAQTGNMGMGNMGMGNNCLRRF